MEFEFNIPTGLKPTKRVKVETLPDVIVDGEKGEHRVVVSTESDHGTSKVVSGDTTWMWGGKVDDVYMNSCKPSGGQEREGFGVAVKDDILYLYLYNANDPMFGMLFPVITSWVGNIELHILDSGVFASHATYIQSALATTSARVKIYLSSISGCPVSSLGLFVAAFATEIAPIPYDIVQVVEPMTFMTDFIGGNLSERNYKTAVHSSIINNNYEMAVARGLITTEECKVLTDGDALNIHDINRRIQVANTIPVKQAMEQAGLI